jgi:nucleotide-binding universal stress UspA family protein
MEVLIGVGGSELSYLALDEVIKRAREVGDSLTVAVFENEEVGADRAAVLAEIRDRLEDAGADAEIRQIEGAPGAGLVEIADGEGYDRIVLGSGSRSTLGKIQLGSVAEFVLLNAGTPVTLIR